MSVALNPFIIFQKVVIFANDGKILALRRRLDDKRRPGAWDLPGGKLEKGEDIVESARREVLEETNLAVENLKPLHIQSLKIKSHDTFDNLYLCWITNFWKGKIKLSQEHVEYRWVTPAEFAALPTWDEQGFLQKSVLAAS